MPKLQRTQYTTIPEGSYQALIVKVEYIENAKGFGGESASGPALDIWWQIEDPGSELDGKTLKQRVSTNFSERSNLGKLSYAVGVSKDTTELDTDDLVGRRGLISVAVTEGANDAQYSNVKEVVALPVVLQKAMAATKSSVASTKTTPPVKTPAVAKVPPPAAKAPVTGSGASPAPPGPAPEQNMPDF